MGVVTHACTVGRAIVILVITATSTLTRNMPKDSFLHELPRARTAPRPDPHPRQSRKRSPPVYSGVSSGSHAIRLQSIHSVFFPHTVHSLPIQHTVIRLQSMNGGVFSHRRHSLPTEHASTSPSDPSTTTCGAPARRPAATFASIRCSRIAIRVRSSVSTAAALEHFHFHCGIRKPECVRGAGRKGLRAGRGEGGVEGEGLVGEVGRSRV